MKQTRRGFLRVAAQNALGAVVVSAAPTALLAMPPRRRIWQVPTNAPVESFVEHNLKSFNPIVVLRPGMALDMKYDEKRRAWLIVEVLDKNARVDLSLVSGIGAIAQDINDPTLLVRAGETNLAGAHGDNIFRRWVDEVTRGFTQSPRAGFSVGGHIAPVRIERRNG